MKRTWLARGVACSLAIVCLASPRVALAQHVGLTFDGGRVTLAAHDVSVRQILAEWARIGETEVVDAELVSDERVSLQLDGVPERQALDVVLRASAGYMTVERRNDNPGLSTYARILVLASSQAVEARERPVSDSTSPVFAREASPSPTEPELPLEPAEPSPEPESPDLLLEAELLEPELDPETAANVAVGREPGAKPSDLNTIPVAAAPESDLKELPVGRPEGARPGRIVPVVAGAPAAAAPGVGEPTSGPTDANGRPRTKP